MDHFFPTLMFSLFSARFDEKGREHLLSTLPRLLWAPTQLRTNCANIPAYHLFFRSIHGADYLHSDTRRAPQAFAMSRAHREPGQFSARSGGQGAGFTDTLVGNANDFLDDSGISVGLPIGLRQRCDLVSHLVA